MKLQTGLKGSITIFVSMIFMTMLIFVCVILENVRLSSAAAKAEGITYMGLDSCFAEYAKELFGEYGVMYIWGSEDDISKRMEEIVKLNCGKDVTDIYGLKPCVIDIKNIEYATDYGGKDFENQVFQYMKYKLGEEAVAKLAESIKGKYGVLEESEKISKVYDRITECADSFEEAEESVSLIASDVKKLNERCVSPSDMINDMADESDESSAELKYAEYCKWSDGSHELLKDIESKAQEFDTKSADARKSAEELREYLENDKEGMSAEVYNSLESEVKSICEKFDGSDGYGINACRKAAETADTNITKLDGETALYIGESYGDKIKANELKDMAGKTVISGVELNFQIPGESVQEEDVQGKVSNMMENGILNLVVADINNVSDRKIEDSMKISEEIEEYTGEDGLQRRIMFAEYAVEHFGNYIHNTEDTGLQYETEYILSGKDNDRDNLSDTVEKIVAIRCGFNMLSIMKDTAKMEETYAAAVAVAGVTAMPLVIKVAQIGIVSGWALAESVADVKNLMAGKKVAVLKSPQQWNLSLSHVTNIKGVTKKEDDKGGLGYEDYLIFMLSAQEYSKQIKRTMDLVQINIGKNYDENFKLSECVNSVSVEYGYTIDKLFNIFAPSFATKNRYDIWISQKFSY